MFLGYNCRIMRKRLAFVVFLTIVLPISGQQQSPKPDGNQPNGNGTTNPAPPTHRVITCEVKQEGTTIECQWPESVPEGYFKRLFSPGNAPNIALVVVGIAGIVAALCTLKKIERQIKVAEAGTQAIGRAERPWIVIDVESPAPNQFNFIATNTGRIPADVKSIWAAAIVTKRGERLEIPIDDKTGESLMNTPPCLIPPTARQIVFRCNIEEMNKQGSFGRNTTFSQGFVELRFYGRIIYSDILQPESAIPHETKWLYWQVPIQGALPFPDPIHPKHNTYT